MTDDVLDLHELAVLLNYERASTEPRFRYAKLREVSSSVPPYFQTARLQSGEGWSSSRRNKVGYIFDIKQPANAQRDIRDTVSNMLPDPVPQNLQTLSTRGLETIYWQARGHDGCYKTVALLQHFFDLYPDNQPLRIRTATGRDIVTYVANRVILEFILDDPKICTLSTVMPRGESYLSGVQDTMFHAVVEFSGLDEENESTVLDLSSMQFGEDGRGDGGNGTFVLESLDKFHDRIEKISNGCDTSKTKTSPRIGPSADDNWLKSVAARTKIRWENREKEPWCGFCGAPASNKCVGCGQAYYCGKTHQKSAWRFHKNFCR
jgi:MYND finger